MSNNALIIFIKNSGEVKSRIAQEIGNDAAIAIYNELLDYTFSLAQEVKKFCSVHLFFTIKNEDKRWAEISEYQYIQNEGDLGERMSSALHQVLQLNKKVVLVGSDCPYLGATHISESFDQLELADVVIGPANDGGYYLIGMNSLQKNIFSEIPWSTSSVYHSTVDKLYDARLTFVTLDRLDDIDYYKDYQNWKFKKNLT
jgi:uncharacterized protein